VETEAFHCDDQVILHLQEMEQATELVEKEEAEYGVCAAKTKTRKAKKSKAKERSEPDTADLEHQLIDDRVSGEAQKGETSIRDVEKNIMKTYRKRKQPLDEITTDPGEKSIEEAKVEEPQNKQKSKASPVVCRSSRPLQGKVVAVSTLTVGSSAKHNYKTLSLLCEQAGALVTGQVHKKVAYVVATEEAAGCGRHPPTQRVRKAWKRQIPVVSVHWVQECIDRCQLLSFEGLLLEQTQQTPKSSARSKDGDSIGEDRRATANDGGAPLEEKITDLGCCCVCHDNGDKECEWCVDCSVNRAAAIAAESL
jgi:BRCA1 C Terminus (BRCT) domain